MGPVPAAELTVEHGGRFYPLVWDLRENTIVDFSDGGAREVMTLGESIQGDMFAWLELVCSLL